MSTNTQNERPLYRITFARVTGQDSEGNNQLSRPREIGAVWARKNGKAGGLMVLDLIPVELTQREGVIFPVPVNQVAKDGAQ